jgi:para-aminobenzoate synthetase/4-amino-4-deoxychorismate lyase
MHPPFAILDFPASPSRGGASLHFCDPLAVLEARTIAEVEPLMRKIDAETARGHHAVGFVAYEAGPAFDPALAAHAPGEAGALPLAWFAIFGAPQPTGAALPAPHSTAPSASWRQRSDSADYARAVATIRQAIGRGDVYQVNHTIRLDVDTDGDMPALYQRLLAAQGPGYGARIHTGRYEILSASPELFFDRRSGTIESRPMKGTARRGRWLAEDDQRAQALSASEKERAENVMIVDLIRNDLGHIAIPGSVRVPRLFDVERRPTVLQMTSTATASLKPGVTTWDVFAALFPCGSITGAPKIAASRMIATLERDPRGVYCGAIGHIAPGGDATFSVAIRTLTVDHETGRAEYGVGSGITWDSAESAEYDEVVAKAGILTADLPAFELLETLRFAGGRYARRARHLARLESSAAYFGFPGASLIRAAADAALNRHAQTAGPSERVRLRAGADASIFIDASPAPPPFDAPPAFALARSPVRRNNRFLFHKTTHRTVYDRHRAEHPGAFDVLLWNEDGELTEFTIGNLVIELDGVRVTPPRECGLLAGTFRDELLEHREIGERVVRREDLARATRVWMVNSLREWTLLLREPLREPLR